MKGLEIRPARSTDADSAVDLVIRSFDEFVAPDYPDEGIAKFHTDVTPDCLVQAIDNGDIVLIGTMDGNLAGIIKIRDETHISWLFVDKVYQERGVGRELIVKAVAGILERNPEATRITVNSSPFALPIYTRMGFEISGKEKCVDGMRFIPVEAKTAIFT